MKNVIAIFFAVFILLSSSFAQRDFRAEKYKASVISSIRERAAEIQSNPAASFNSQKFDFYRPVLAVTDTSRFIYSYDNNGNLLNELRERKNGTGWLNDMQLIYEYDQNGNMLTEIFQIWNVEWENVFKKIFTYDNNNRELTFLFQRWNNGEWENYIFTTIEYDPSNILSMISDEWENGIWIHDWRLTFIYEGAVRKQSYNDIWLNDEWVPDTRTTFNYQNGYPDNSVTEKWLNNAWQFHFRYSYEYNINGERTMLARETWTSEWIKDFRYVYTYNTDGFMISETYEEGLNNSWVYVSKKIWEYEAGNPVMELRQSWSSGWIDASKSEYVYDNYGNAVTGSSYLWNGQWIPGTGQIYMYSNNMNDLITYNVVFVNVTYDMFTDVEEVKGNEIKFNLADNYPNPFNPQTIISFSIPEATHVSIKVYDITGNEAAIILNEEKSPGIYKVTWSPEGLASGVYLYKLETSQGFVQTKKMVYLK